MRTAMRVFLWIVVAGMSANWMFAASRGAVQPGSSDVGAAALLQLEATRPDLAEPDRYLRKAQDLGRPSRFRCMVLFYAELFLIFVGASATIWYAKDHRSQQSRGKFGLSGADFSTSNPGVIILAFALVLLIVFRDVILL